MVVIYALRLEGEYQFSSYINFYLQTKLRGALMNQEKYEENGSYAAQVDFNISPRYLLDAIISAYEAAVSTAVVDAFDSSSSWKWGLDYLETGLALLGFTDIASLVKTDFSKSTKLFAEKIREGELSATETN